jgi:hypothetical protein
LPELAQQVTTTLKRIKMRPGKSREYGRGTVNDSWRDMIVVDSEALYARAIKSVVGQSRQTERCGLADRVSQLNIQRFIPFNNTINIITYSIRARIQIIAFGLDTITHQFTFNTLGRVKYA